MKVAMFSSEVLPFAKTGGLADVVYSLSKELARGGHEVLVAMPFYSKMKGKVKKSKHIGSFPVQLSWRTQYADVYETSVDGIRYLLIGNDYYFGRENIYGYNDDGERFAFYALACCRLLTYVKFKPDIVHVHDWQAAMIPVLFKEKYGADSFYKDIKTVLTIHNPAFKGILDKYYVYDYFGLPEELVDNGKLRFDGRLSTLKGGIGYANKITTVSPTHREELLHPETAQGLHYILELRRYDFVGILNGIDTDEWNPETDKFINTQYSIKDVEKGKRENQKDLLTAFHIHKAGPVYSITSRLSYQKGIDLIIESGRKAMVKGATLIILGSGEYELEQKAAELRKEFPDRCGIYIGYSDELAHKIYAGSDFFLMPSLFEPCGISQMISQRYGVLPIVRYTGGLVDTVEGYYGDKNINAATGIGFNDYDVQGMDYAFGKSRELYEDQDRYWQVVRQAMSLDHSWKKSTEKYLELYKSIK